MMVPQQSCGIVTAVRIRPLSETEEQYGNELVAWAGSNQGEIILLDPCFYHTQQTSSDRKVNERTFQFDHIFSPYPSKLRSTQSEIYDAVGKSLLTNALAGQNCALFAYGDISSLE
jgi:hypothetical protein